MGRTLDLPSVIELTPCKYKRVYFYFGVQKKLIFIYLFFFIFIFWGRFDFHFEADLTGNRLNRVVSPENGLVLSDKPRISGW